MIRFALALTALAAAQPVLALPPDMVQGQILTGWQTDRNTRMAAVHLHLADGWKTYWRSPGDAGIPPQFDWSGSRNVKGVRLHWPVPSVFLTSGMHTIGYHHDLVLPVEVTPADPALPVHLDLKMDLGVCSAVCVPAQVAMQADLDGAGRRDPAIAAALDRQPSKGARDVTCTLDPIDDGLRVTARMTVPPQGASETVVMEPADAEIWTSPAEVRRDGDRLTASSDFVAGSGGLFALDRSTLKLTVIGDGQAVETTGCPAP